MKKIFILILSLVVTTPSIADVISLKGIVVNKHTNEPLIKADVYLKKADCGTVTDEDGVFFITCDINTTDDTLIVSYLGFKNYSCAWESIKKPLIIYLEPEPLPLKDAIIVQGERIDLLQQDIPHTSNVVSFKEIEMYGSSEIGDIFKPLPSVRIEGNDLDGRNIQIRGSDPEEVNVYIDGILINQLQFNNAADLSIIPIDNIERVEVLKGGNSTFLGSGAFGGVVNILSRQRQERSFNVKGKIGSFKSKYITGNLNVPLSKKLSINYFGQHNSFSPEIEYFPSERYSQKTENKEITTKKQNHQIGLDYFFKNGQISARTLAYILKYQKPAWESRYTNLLSAIIYQGQIFGMRDFEININHLGGNNSIDRIQNEDTYHTSSYITNRLNAKIIKKFSAQTHYIQILTEYYHDDLKNNKKIKYLDWEKDVYNTFVFDNRLSIAAVFSFKNQMSDTSKYAWQFYAGSRSDILANGNNNLTNTVGIQTEYTKNNLKFIPFANYGQNYRYPSLLENAYAKDIINPFRADSIYSHLEPEYSTSGEFGINMEYYPSKKSLGIIKLGGSVFSRTIYNKILRRPYDDIIAQSPIARSDIKGIEGFLKCSEIFNHLNFNSSFTLLNIENPLQIAFKPDSYSSIQLQYYKRTGLYFNITYFREGKSTIWFYNEEDEIQTDEIQPFSDMDVSIGMRVPINKLNLNLQFSVFNAFDRSGYQYYYLKKRNIQVSLAINY